MDDTNNFPDQRKVRRRLWRAEAVYVSGLAIFAILAVCAHIYAYFGWDLRVAHAIQSVHGLYGFMSFVSFFGNEVVPFALTAITILILWWFKLKPEAYGLLLSTAGGETLNRLLKLIIGRPRPAADLVTIMQVEPSQSFPSGHVTFYVLYFGFLLFLAYAHLPRGSLARRAAITLCALPILLIGFSRVYLGAHWPSDTIGAYLFAGIWLAVSVHFYRRFKVSKEERLSSV
jgi:membrane-associated phospholipid phosphatase